MSKLHGIPSHSELLEAVRSWLNESVLQKAEGAERFYTRVAVNILAIVEREIRLGAEQEARHVERLASLGVADDAEFSAKIRRREFSVDQPEVISVVRDSVRDKLLVANPDYLDE